MKRRVQYTALSIIIFCFGVFIYLKWGAALSADLVYTMVNVNATRQQGDAHLIEVGNGKTVLIDAGSLGPAKEKLVPFLKKKKVKKIDIVFISHPHKDHYEGLLPILDAGILINEIYFNIPDKALCDREIPWGCNYQHILEYHQKLKKHGVKIKLAKPGLVFDLGNEATIKILYVFDGIHTPVGKTDINDLSLIMMLEQFGHKVLFTGDLNRPIGGYLAENAHDIQAEILKMPHHGTEGAAPNSFFQAVDPEYALVPAPSHLWCSKRSLRIREWFKKNQIPVFVNGFHGNVKIEIQKKKIRIIPENEVMNLCQE